MKIKRVFALSVTILSIISLSSLLSRPAAHTPCRTHIYAAALNIFKSYSVRSVPCGTEHATDIENVYFVFFGRPRHTTGARSRPDLQGFFG